MNRLDPSIILDLVKKFIGLTTDEKRQTVVDSLGLHPVNHAHFSRFLNQYGHAHDWQVYLDLTRSIS